MARYRKKPVLTEINAEIYHKGLEDGFACFGFKGNNPYWGCHIQDTKGCNNCLQFKPYIIRWGHKYPIEKGDYISIDICETKQVFNPDEFKKIYEKINY